jgi:hypothetical protein
VLFLPNTLGLHGYSYFRIELGEADIGLKHLLLRTKASNGLDFALTFYMIGRRSASLSGSIRVGKFSFYAIRTTRCHDGPAKCYCWCSLPVMHGLIK